jgi:hypothetical protein
MKEHRKKFRKAGRQTVRLGCTKADRLKIR